MLLLLVLHFVPFFSLRVGQRGTGLSATIARSEHEISEIIDGLSEQEVGTSCRTFEVLFLCRGLIVSSRNHAGSYCEISTAFLIEGKYLSTSAAPDFLQLLHNRSFSFFHNTVAS